MSIFSRNNFLTVLAFLLIIGIVGVLIIFYVKAPISSSNTTATPEDIPVSQNIFEKKINWCKEAKNELWISSEHFMGMNHAPTIRHVCRGANEVFYLTMDWNNAAIQHSGTLFAVASSSTFPVISTHKDPEFTLLDVQSAQHPNQIWISVDGKTIIFDETSSKFIDEVASEERNGV